MSKLAAKIRAQFIGLLLVFAIALVGVAAAGAWGLGQTATAANKLYGDHLQTAQVTAALAQNLDDAYEIAQSLLLATTVGDRRQLTRQLFATQIPNVEVSLAELQKLHANDPSAERALVQQLVTGWGQFRALWSGDALFAFIPNPAAVDVRLRAAFEPIEPVTDDLQAIEQHDAEIAHQRGQVAYRTSLVLIGVVAVAGLFAGIALVAFVTRRVLPRSMAPEQAQAAFIEALQLSADEADAQALLTRHLHRATSAAEIVVLNRSETDSLDAVTELSEASPLHDTLPGVLGRACAAIRAARPHHSASGQEQLQPCQVCGPCAGTSLCTPLTVGGQIIGSVLVNQAAPLDADDERTIHDSITQAAPVIANLRNLATAKNQAATDALTGLPNKRSAAETLNRMVAHAHRAVSPLTALSIDLDHFKAINDLHGHGRGDEVLAAVGSALRSALRTSDFAARNGGEEFLVLLPDTPTEQGLLCAQRIQTALRQIAVLAGESPITASIGLAVLPENAHDRTSLEQAADRAVYLAKRNGRNRIETADGPTETALTIQSLITSSTRE